MSKDPELRLTHREFAEVDERFQKACQNAGIEPTRRQAQKFRDGRGLAFANRDKEK